MKKLLIVAVLIAFVVSPVSAKELDPDELPKWLTPECAHLIATIIQHEAGNMKSPVVFHFMAAQIIMDAERMGCEKLTDWRWKIKSFPKPSQIALNAVWDYPTNYPKCGLIGFPGDVPVWRSYGYRARVDFSFTVRKWTVIGADCQMLPPQISIRFPKSILADE